MKSKHTFEIVFKQATGFKAFPYQRRLAESGLPPAIVSVPTGLGKTAGAVLGWLWRRRYAPPDIRNQTPRRMAYCLPMRVLVEQTHDCISGWLQNLGIADAKSIDGVRLSMLMGGESDQEWDLFPEQDSIMVGTQDMLLSRALNRGFAMSRFRWPVAFGLLNNDCLWIVDEVQLMGAGLSTTSQLAAFRRQLGTMGVVQTQWMSATLRPEWLQTVDFDPAQDAPGALMLDESDLAFPVVKDRFHARKSLRSAPVDTGASEKETAEIVLGAHRAGTLTLVIVNTVKRARGLHAAMEKKKPKADLVLLHSRFRPPDRARMVERLLAKPGPHGTIAVTTQVVEAGVDVSAATLFTDLAPWASLVQRFGRCNRKGEIPEGCVFWFDNPLNKKNAALPYLDDELEDARGRLSGLKDAAPAHLDAVGALARSGPVLRRKDVVELFDTTPDLAGADLDISRYIREDEDHDVQVFWRTWDPGPPPAELPAPRREELCPVPISEARTLNAWRWDHLDKRWESTANRNDLVYPGLVLLLHVKEGCYSPENGWTGNRQDRPELILDLTGRDQLAEGDDDDPWSVTSPQTLSQHTVAVLKELEGILSDLGLSAHPASDLLRLSALWHDAGKSHEVARKALGKHAPALPAGESWAKTGGKGRLEYERKGFRHELASALAMLVNGLPDLAAYLAAAHHGKVRLSIRSLPHEEPPSDSQKRFARGVHDGDELPATSLGKGNTMPATKIDLSYMEMGVGPRGASWAARMLALRDDPEQGPFRIAYLEALLRAADRRASKNEGGGA